MGWRANVRINVLGRVYERERGTVCVCVCVYRKCVWWVYVHVTVQ